LHELVSTVVARTELTRPSRPGNELAGSRRHRRGRCGSTGTELPRRRGPLRPRSPHLLPRPGLHWPGLPVPSLPRSSLPRSSLPGILLCLSGRHGA
jgi:hypothetical protein